MPKILALLGLLSLFVANAAGAALPNLLIGTWEDADNDEHGTMTVTVTKEMGARIEGIIRLTGSADCVAPIPFQGTRSPYRIDVIADTPGICGHNGTLSAIVAKTVQQGNPNNEYYTGAFSYSLFGGIWRRGTFKLTPQDKT